MQQPRGRTPREILIVDDHPLVRMGLAGLIATQSDLSLAGEANCPERAFEILRSSRVDLVVTDLTFGQASGLDFIRQVRREWAKMPVMVLSGQNEDVYVERALRLGAAGYVTKEAPMSVILQAMRQMLDEGLYVSDKTATAVLARLADSRGDIRLMETERLSRRELEIFRYIGHGMTTRQVASKLQRSIKTIDTHREHIKEKLQLRDARELLQRAIQYVQMTEDA